MQSNEQSSMSRSPRLRSDLRIMPFKDAEGEAYVIEDPLRNTYYKIGQREYGFLCFLDQGGTLDTLPGEVEPDAEQITREEAATVLKWLAGKQLLQRLEPDVLELIDGEQQKAAKPWFGRLNFIVFRLPLFNPDPFLTRIMPWIGWMVGPVFFTAWAVLAVLAMLTLVTEWQAFTSQATVFFATENLIVVGCIWILLKALHELSHAVTCRRYGGRVYEAGVLFILFFPLTYVNATSSWRLNHRWQRLYVTGAGMLTELFIASLALIYWSSHQGTAAGMIAHNTVIIAGVSSLLFNANPLMRFDGYYLLSDFVSLPNLYFLGLDSVKRSLKKWWLGIEDEGAPEYGFWLRLYGVMVYLWRIVVIVSLSVFASVMFSGWGLLLVFGAMIGWIYGPISRFVKDFPQYRSTNPQVVKTFVSRLSLCVILAAACLVGIRWQPNVLIPAVVIYEKQFSVRSAAPGFIREVFVEHGQRVKKGEPLFALSNRELEHDYNQLRLELDDLGLQMRKADAEGQLAQLQILRQNMASLQERRQVLQDDLDNLSIVSPGDGVIVGRDLAKYVGLWSNAGRELCQVVNPDHTRLVASVGQDEISSLSFYEGDTVRIDMSDAGQGIFAGRVERVSPTASKELVHFALAAPFGGALDVVAARDNGNQQYELLQPRFSVYIGLPWEKADILRDGQRAYLLESTARQSLGRLFSSTIASWIDGKKSS